MMEQFSNIIRQEPTTDKYKTLKNVIISGLPDSRHNQIKKHLRKIRLAKRTPFQLLWYMRTLVSSFIDNTILQQIWFEQMPAHIKQHLIKISELPLDIIAVFADRFYQLVSNSRQNDLVMRIFVPYSASTPLCTDPKIMEIQRSFFMYMTEIIEFKLTQKNKQQYLLTAHITSTTKSTTAVPTISDAP